MLLKRNKINSIVKWEFGKHLLKCTRNLYNETCPGHHRWFWFGPDFEIFICELQLTKSESKGKYNQAQEKKKCYSHFLNPKWHGKMLILFSQGKNSVFMGVRESQQLLICGYFFHGRANKLSILHIVKNRFWFFPPKIHYASECIFNTCAVFNKKYL